MKGSKLNCISILTIFIIFWSYYIHAAPVQIPENFPVPTVFKPIYNLKPNSRMFNERLKQISPFEIVLATGPDHIFPLVKEKWSNKIMLIQDAYGGIGERDFPDVWVGHLLLKAGTLLTGSISPTEIYIPVQDLGRIAKNRKIISAVNKRGHFALTIYALDPKTKKPEWSHAEHVILNDIQDGKLVVSRGQWGSKPFSFRAGMAVIAPHMMFWRNQWQLNFSLHSPRGGPDNLTAAEWFARKVAKRITSNKSAHANGIEFDVGRWTWGFPEANPMDINNDLVPDYGYIDGVNSFGLGGQILFQELRKQLGPDIIIQADSNDAIHGIRGWKNINGVEMEAFPVANDFNRFSEAFQHLRLWVENAEALPRFSYPLTKTPTTFFANEYLPGGVKTNFRFRIGLATACLIGMPNPFANLNNEDVDPANFKLKEQKTKETFGIFDWDEYHAGDLNKWSWLGHPVTVAKQNFSDLNDKNLLAKAGWRWKTTEGFEAKQDQTNGNYSAKVQRIPNSILPEKMWFGVHLEPKSKIADMITGKEYTLEFDARGDDEWNYTGQHFSRVPRMIAIKGAFETKTEKPISLLADSNWRTYRISFTANSTRTSTPVFGVSEQIGTTNIRNIKLFEGSSERWLREFENGLVLLNMTNKPWQVSVKKGYYRHLKGLQDPAINNGQLVDSLITVPARDAIFLIKR
ncbi:MAG: hypothetical protein IPN42_08060 [Methylococcaceae bacterium]|nr:hypothetical protein [Methylococcaceae bacterium]